MAGSSESISVFTSTPPSAGSPTGASVKLKFSRVAAPCGRLARRNWRLMAAALAVMAVSPGGGLSAATAMLAAPPWHARCPRRPGAWAQLGLDRQPGPRVAQRQGAAVRLRHQPAQVHAQANAAGGAGAGAVGSVEGLGQAGELLLGHAGAEVAHLDAHARAVRRRG